MLRAHSRRKWAPHGARARLLFVGALGALALLGALTASGGAAADAAAAAAGTGPHSTYVVQHAATVAANATSPSRSHRVALTGGLIVLAVSAAIAARRLASRSRRGTRRRGEQFHVLLRAPPLVVVSH